MNVTLKQTNEQSPKYLLTCPERKSPEPTRLAQPQVRAGRWKEGGGSEGAPQSALGRPGLSSGTYCPAPVSWEAAAITFYTVLVGNPSHSLRSRKNSEGNVTLS